MSTENYLRKIFGAAVIFILLLITNISPLSAIKNDLWMNDNETPLHGSFTHTVFGEEATATTCSFCPNVIQILYNIYNSGEYDFYYVALVADRNTYASQRLSELGVAGYPTVVYDGDYQRVFGGGHPEPTHIAAINACGTRVVADVDLSLDVHWLGNAQLGVYLNVTNNEATDYNGRIRVFVTEINSRWYCMGHQYHFAMIGNYAINQDITVPSGTTLPYQNIWDGNLYEMGDIQQNNIMVIAAVYCSQTNYVDETTASMVRDTSPPEWQNQGQNRSLVPQGESVLLYAQAQDNFGLDFAVLATNETGYWANITNGDYGSPMYLGGIGNEWIWSNFTWQNPNISPGKTIGWRIYYNDTSGNRNSTDILSFVITPTHSTNLMHVFGYCTYPDFSPASDIRVELINLNTEEQWQAHTISNQYSRYLIIGEDINIGDILRIIARDADGSVNVTDHLIDSEQISSGLIQVDLVLDIHYRDLKHFPFYYSQVDTGAAVMKMMLDYLMWNSTIYNEPQSVYSEQDLYNSYADGNYISASMMSSGLNTEIDDGNQVPPYSYGYFFSTAYDDDAVEVLRHICVWLDYNVSGHNDFRTVDVPKMGHPHHVPVAVPTGGNYDNWMVIRGIHTNRSLWDRSVPGYHQLIQGPVSMYGLWLNDPCASGLGEGTYVTAQYFIEAYFERLDVPDDVFNGKYVALVDPPQDILNIELTDFDMGITQGEGFTADQIALITVAMKLGVFDDIVCHIIVEQAEAFLNTIIFFDSLYSTSKLIAVSKILHNNFQFIVTFYCSTSDMNIDVFLDAGTGVGQQFTIYS